VDEWKPLVAGNGKEALAAIDRKAKKSLAAPAAPFHLVLMVGRCRMTPGRPRSISAFETIYDI
jgi:hypothetical protein